MNKKIIGRVEKVDFPQWNAFGIEAKIDTGAYTSSLHCSEMIQESRNGVLWVNFTLLGAAPPNFQKIRLAAPVFKEKKVKNSSGTFEYRPFIKTQIGLFGKIYTIELSLTDRSAMRFPVLLGRKILKGRFLVDVSQTYLSHSLKGKIP